jgi:PAS domain S-box-containing protein
MVNPLLCWDIIQEGMERRSLLAYDLQKMSSISIANQWHNVYMMPDSALIWENKVIIITDQRLRIIHATANMYQLNGYNPREVIGRSPKMFQGKATSLEERRPIRMAVETRSNFDAIITNYRKDSSLYKCHIEGYPIFNSNGELVNYIAFENVA